MTTRRYGPWASALLALVLACPSSGGAAPGDLDPTFGSGGRAAVAFPGEATPRDLVVLPDGRLVLAGTVVHEDSGRFTFALARVDARGTLDPGFGEAGITITHFPPDQVGIQAQKVATLADGRLLVGGVDFGAGVPAPVLARYGEDGSLDEGFEQGGFRRLVGSTFVDMVVNDVAVLALTRQRANNIEERTLALSNGLGTFALTVPRPDGGRARAMAARADGRVVLVEAGPQMIVTRLADLEGDPSFGAQGDAVVPPDVALNEVTAVIPLPDGRLVITGEVGSRGSAQAGLVRLLSDGSPDVSFGEGGRVLLADQPDFDTVSDAVPLVDGALIVGGRTCGTTCSGFLVRIREDGVVDSSFGQGGIVSALPDLDTLALADDQHLLVLGKENQQMVLTRHFVSTCGNGALEAGEGCDDGNTEGGDCCAADCTAERDGGLCPPDDSACTADVCRAGSCTHEVPGEPGCAIAESSALVLVDDANDANDRIRLRWSSATVPPDLLGDPTTTTDVSLCVIDGPPEARRIVAELTAPGGAVCGSASCWRRTATGFRYRDRTKGNDGIGRLILSVDGTDAGILLKAKGPGVDVRTLATGDRLLVRVVQDDAPGCFESTVVTAGTGATRLRATTR